MREPNDVSGNGPLRVGSLFSGYGGLDLPVEQVFDARTVWFSEIKEHVAHVFSHHWPDAPNLGDITTIDWSAAEPVDVLCGGFPCQDVSTVGKMAGLKPGTRSRRSSGTSRSRPPRATSIPITGTSPKPPGRPTSSSPQSPQGRRPAAATDPVYEHPESTLRPSKQGAGAADYLQIGAPRGHLLVHSVNVGVKHEWSTSPVGRSAGSTEWARQRPCPETTKPW